MTVPWRWKSKNGIFWMSCRAFVASECCRTRDADSPGLHSQIPTDFPIGNDMWYSCVCVHIILLLASLRAQKNPIKTPS